MVKLIFLLIKLLDNDVPINPEPPTRTILEIINSLTFV